MRYLHTMLRVHDLERAVHFFTTQLGLEELRRKVNEGGRFTLVFLGSGAADDPAEIELTYNWDQAEPYTTGRFFGHLAFEVDDIYATCARLRESGVDILRPPRDGRMAFIKSPDGHSVELLQRGEALAPAEPWSSLPNQGSWWVERTVPFSGFSASAIALLAELAQNNHREWFQSQSDAFDGLLIAPAKELVIELGHRLQGLDPELRAVPRVRGSIKAFELRRRFQQREQPPYKEHLDIWFWSGPRREWDNSGFFLRLSANRLVLAGGMIEFQKEALARYREAVVDEERGPALSTIVSDLRRGGYVVGGESYKHTPRGISADFPRAALARHSGVFATFECPHPPELATAAFVDFCFAHFARMNELHGWLVALQARATTSRRK